MTLQLDRRPLYVQARDRLLALIREQPLGAGERLPSEATLSAQLGISRATLREALRLLEEEGAIVRRQWLGTFVASRSPLLESGLEVLESLESLARRIGLHTEVAHLDVVERLATEEEAEGLRLPPDGPKDVLAVSRVIAVAGQPVAYLVDVVPQEFLRYEELGEHFNGSVLELFLERRSPVLAYSTTEIAAEEADPMLAKSLQLRRGRALLKLVGRLHDVNDRVVDYSLSFFVPGYFRFHVVRKVGRI